MTAEEKRVCRIIITIKVQMFLWGFCWCAAFGELWRIIFWDGDFLHPILFAVNAAYGVHFYPFKNGRWQQVGGENGKKES